MYRWIRKKYHQDAHPDFYDKDGTVYTFHGQSLIYQADPAKTKCKKSKDEQNQNRVRFWSLKVRRKWLAFLIPNIIGFATLLVVSVYTYYAQLQVRASEDANNVSRAASRESARSNRVQQSQSNSAINQAKDQFALDQRPYLWLDTDDSKPDRLEKPRFEAVYADKSTGDISIDFLVKNFGKSPAIQVKSLAYMSVGPGAEDDIHWHPFPDEGGGIYPPNATFSKTARTENPVQWDAVQPRPITDLHTPNLWAVHGLIRYADQTGRRYVSEICFVMQANGVSKRCKHHNEVR